MRHAAVYVWLRLARVFQRVDRRTADQLRAWDLSVAQFDVLAQVGLAEGMTQQELADRLLVTKGNVSQLLERLERRGLIRRCPEGRLSRLYLTNEGRTLRDEVLPMQEQFICDQFAALSDDDLARLRDILVRLDHALRESAHR